MNPIFSLPSSEAVKTHRALIAGAGMRESCERLRYSVPVRTAGGATVLDTFTPSNDGCGVTGMRSTGAYRGLWVGCVAIPRGVGKRTRLYFPPHWTAMLAIGLTA